MSEAKVEFRKRGPVPKLDGMEEIIAKLYMEDKLSIRKIRDILEAEYGIKVSAATVHYSLGKLTEDRKWL